MFKLFFAVLYYECLSFLRDQKAIWHALGFFVMMTILFPIALSPHPDLLEEFAPGILWVAALLAVLLALENWLYADLEDYALEQLLLSSFPLPWLIAAKMTAFWLVAIVPLILAVPVLGALLHLGGPDIFMLIMGLLAGTPALLAIGAACKTLTCHLQQQGVLLGLLVLPLALPVLIMGVNLQVLARLALPVWGHLAFLAGVSLLCCSILPCAIAYTLRWGIES